jgi:glycosyltransferase involved in cell wall biosynthesis
VLRKLDVGLIPHQINAFSKGLRPLKLVEYLSAGLPIVATRLPELAGLEKLVAFSGDSRDEFVKASEIALSRRRAPDFSAAAQAWARQFTWSNLAIQQIIPALRRSELLKSHAITGQ